MHRSGQRTDTVTGGDSFGLLGTRGVQNRCGSRDRSLCPRRQLRVAGARLRARRPARADSSPPSGSSSSAAGCLRVPARTWSQQHAARLWLCSSKQAIFLLPLLSVCLPVFSPSLLLSLPPPPSPAQPPSLALVLSCTSSDGSSSSRLLDLSSHQACFLVFVGFFYERSGPSPSLGSPFFISLFFLQHPLAETITCPSPGTRTCSRAQSEAAHAAEQDEASRERMKGGRSGGERRMQQ